MGIKAAAWSPKSLSSPKKRFLKELQQVCGPAIHGAEFVIDRLLKILCFSSEQASCPLNLKLLELQYAQLCYTNY